LPTQSAQVSVGNSFVYLNFDNRLYSAQWIIPNDFKAFDKVAWVITAIE